MGVVNVIRQLFLQLIHSTESYHKGTSMGKHDKQNRVKIESQIESRVWASRHRKRRRRWERCKRVVDRHVV
jgi:hypothetical protein